MHTRRSRWLLCVLCLGLAVVAVAQDKAPSVVERVQQVDDPELGELIRLTMTQQGRENLNQRDKLELIRRVTLGYSQIRLLDQQIAEVSRKLKAETGPTEIQRELLLARTELEAKLAGELTNLRTVIGIVPKYAFDRQPVQGLHTSLRLNPIDDDRVYVLDVEDPTTAYWAMDRFKSLGLMSHNDVLNLIRTRVKDPNNLPLRVNILWRNQAGERLRDAVIATLRTMGAAMQAEVDLARNPFIGSGEAPFILRQGKIITFYPAPVQRPDAPPGTLLVNGPVSPEDIGVHILWRITFQWNLPLTFRIEYDRASSNLAQRIADEIKATATRLGVAELVGVKPVQVEPMDEAVFLGRWRGISEGEIREIDIRPEGHSWLTMDANLNWMKGDPTVPAPWLMATREIFVDPQKVSDKGHRYVYRGHINSAGNLVLDKGLFECQGSFGLSGSEPLVLEKME